MEECDDSNTLDRDGCDALCQFEHAHRMSWLKAQYTTDTFCTANRLGSAFTGGTVQAQRQSAMDAAVADGSISNVFTFHGLDDDSATSDPLVDVALWDMLPAVAPGYNGVSDDDWWYAARDPLLAPAALAGSFNAKVLNAGPGTMTLRTDLGTLRLSGARMTVTAGGVSAPLVSTTGDTPGHLESENLDPALVTFDALGQPTANGSGRLCGNARAADLAATPVPSTLVGGGVFACAQGYTTANSWLDVIVGGCTILNVPQVAARQPDAVDAAAPQVGAGGPYALQANAQRVVSTCRDRNNQVVPLQQCLAAAAYSASFKFATRRVLVREP